jgi:hypothetical protein
MGELLWAMLVSIRTQNRRPTGEIATKLTVDLDFRVSSYSIERWSA